MTLWLTRPQAQSKEMAADITQPTLIAPVQTIVPLTVGTIEGEFDAIITTSQHACIGITQFHDLPLYTVGTKSAETARQLGFSLATALAEDATGMAAMVVTAHPEPMRLLYLSGRETRIDLKALLESRGHKVTQIVTYEAQTAATLPPAFIEAWKNGKITGAVFMSVGAVNAAAELLKLHALPTSKCAKIDAFCVSSVVAAAAAALPWRSVHVSTSPTQQSLIETLDATISA